MNNKIIFLVVGFFILTSGIDLAFGHSRSCMKSSDVLRIEDAIFSTHNISVGQTIEIQGMVVSLNPNDQISKMWVVVHNNNDFYFLDDIMKIFSDNRQGCASAYFDENPIWYFEIQNSPSTPFILEGNGVKDFKIDLVGLKSGNYYIHPAVLVDDLFHLGVGGTVHVEGRDGVTDGEIFGFYLPFTASIALITFVAIIGIIGIRRKLQINHRSKGKLS